jgi:hypothetical protein
MIAHNARGMAGPSPRRWPCGFFLLYLPRPRESPGLLCLGGFLLQLLAWKQCKP